jgi:[acyl-carrier-protein] S-malonyltransferase
MALYTCGVAAYRCLVAAKPNVAVKYLAGHSIGEYAALASAEIVSVEDGARAVQKRGQVMAESGRIRLGGMAAIIGLDRDALEAVCKAASTANEVVVIANDNCPGQLVISGDKVAVDRACALATEKGAKRALPLNVSGAFHSPLMEEPAKQMVEVLSKIEFKAAKPGLAVVNNVTAEPISGPEGWAERLVAQLRNPVRWTESVQRMVADGVTTFIECGGGEVLGGLIRRTYKEAVCLKVGDSQTLEQTVSAL